MAEKIINNPSLLPGDLEIELSGGSIIAISGHPLIGSGGGTQSDYVYYPVFDNTTGNVEFHLGTTADNPQPAGGWHISGATGPQGIQGERGIQGIQGIPGVDGKNPVFEIDSSNAHWKWKYAEATSGWTDLGIAASGSVGPKGQDGTNGTNGKDGVSPTVSSREVTGGTEVTFTYGTSQTETITVLDGTPGEKGDDGQKGADGFSPTVTTSEISPTTQHPQGGTSVTITDSVGTHQFDVWNGTNGQGATVNLLDGDGIHITNDGTNYTIGVSADYSAMAVTWVQTQNYLKSVPDTYALKTDVEAASANALSEAESWVGQCGFITKNVDDLTYYYKTTETSSSSEITNALSTKLDSTVAAQTYQTKADMTNYLTTSDASTTYATKAYANEASANALSQAESWVETEGYIKSVPDITANNGLSANGHTVGISNTGIDANKQYAWTTTGWQLVSVPTIPDITANNGLSATGHTVGISTTNIDANKQYAWTTTGWQLVSVPTIPDITAHNGLSADGHTVGIDDTNIAANTQYAWTTNGWAEVDGYLPTSGGTVSGQLVVSATQNTFDDNYIKCINNGNVGYSRFGVGSYGGAVIKTVDGNNNPVQVNVRYNANNNELIQVQKSNADVGYLIPAKIEQAGWTPSADDKILHIVLES